ncbi:hypothetical protein D1816_18980 [Aquimarina sp. AD10]|nr:hypothetical protein [Aquimarina sp. AD10]AXT62359.1 hypothetical protein D1816_18980 [Aquimarina sp. AD10]RKM90445.1 hypothetical protein D7033_23400 [Aquimarina sp. AD10]
MDIKSKVAEMDSVVSTGAIVDAVQQFFADNASTSDYNGGTTINKEQMVQKMEGFAGAIAQVNGITHHATIVDGNESASEFTFDFNMKDGSKIYWHEIIRRTWNSEGKVSREEYFNAQ